jgi:hypothetical protein
MTKNKLKPINIKGKTSIILLMLFTTLIFACEKDSNSNSNNSVKPNTPGGNTGGPGTSVGSTTGSVKISATWSNPAPWNACNVPYSVVIGLGYSSTDVTNESYFGSSSFVNSAATLEWGGLSPGVYYYGAKKTFNASVCGTGQGIPPAVKKSGSFTIVAGQTTSVTSVSLN